MCFWQETKYRIYENQPVSMLGILGPEIYKNICSNFHVTRYELLNGNLHILQADDWKKFFS